MATRRMLSCLGQWSSRVFAFTGDIRSDPTYFTLSTQTKNCDEPPAFSTPFQGDGLYSLHVYCDDRIKKVKCHAELKNKLLATFDGCNVLPMSSFQPDVNHSVIEGYLLKVATERVTERALGELLRNDPVCVCSYIFEEDGQQCWQQVWSRAQDGSLVVSDRYRVVPAEIPERHPSTLSIVNSDVFYSFEEAYKVMEECINIIPESRPVLETVNQRSEVEGEESFPIIVIEGLDATGKTTLTRSLKEALNAALLTSPPPCLSPWRAHFNCEPPLIRRAFYSLGNYITAGQIYKESTHTPVIVDRFWHSTAAYAIASAVGGRVNNLPKAGSEVYRWPSDLLRPSLVLILSLSPQERMRRLRVRGQDKTTEEAELEANHLFRQKVEEAYTRIEGPACVTVDAGPSPEEVLQQVLLLIKDKCHL